jgi:translation initiation factor 2 alpha subunit (eIF-2alpha)
MVYLFKRKFPKPDDLVMAKIIAINKNGIDVALPEYNNITGFITFTEVSRKKKRDIDKIVFIGNEMVMLVIKTDEEKGYIDLSKRDVKDTEVKEYGDKIKLHKNLYNLFKYILLKLKGIEDINKITEQELYPFLSKTLFEIQEESELDNKSILDKLLNKESNTEMLNLIEYEDLYWKLDDLKEILDHYIDTKINTKKDSKKTNFMMLTYDSNGLNDIKYTLDYKSFVFYPNVSELFDIEITYTSATNYALSIDQKEFGMGQIDDCLRLLVNEISARAKEKNVMLG